MFKIGDKIVNKITGNHGVVRPFPGKPEPAAYYDLVYTEDYGLSYDDGSSVWYFENEKCGSKLFMFKNWEKIEEPNDILKQFLNKSTEST